MTEEQARAALLVRSIEVTDDAQTVWSRDDRQWATDAARRDVGSQSGGEADRRFVSARAAHVLRRLEPQHVAVRRALRQVTWPRWLGVVLPLIAAILGLLSNALGDDRRINIISLPLLGLLAWNALAYVLLALRAVRRRRRAALRDSVWLRVLSLGAQDARELKRDSSPLDAAIAPFTREWLRLAGPLNAARVRLMLHTSALSYALGAVAGMYGRGLGLEYLAGWESTFLEPSAVRALLLTLLGPASLLSGINIPGVDTLAAMRWSEGGNGAPAAPWIHLYAITALLFVMLPRAVLAIVNATETRRRQRRFALPLHGDPYFRRLLTSRSGESLRIHVVPYAHTPDERSRELVRESFSSALGAVDLGFGSPVAYGDEDATEVATNAEITRADLVVVLLSLSTTPEAENAGHFAERLKAARGQQQVLFVLSEDAYARRLKGQADALRRLTERRAAWTAMLQPLSLPFVSLGASDENTREWARRIESLLTGELARSGAA